MGLSLSAKSGQLAPGETEFCVLGVEQESNGSTCVIPHCNYSLEYLSQLMKSQTRVSKGKYWIKIAE